MSDHEVVGQRSRTDLVTPLNHRLIHAMAGEAVGAILGSNAHRNVLSVKWLRRVREETEKAWYEALRAGRGDEYARFLYTSDLYAMLSVHCYLDVTAQTCRMTAGWLQTTGVCESGKVKSLMDCWAGVGMSTAHMALSVPEATWTYHNSSGLQYRIAERLFQLVDEAYGVKVLTAVDEEISVADDFESSDGLLWFECMEHFHDPVSEALRFIEKDTRLIVDCSSFSYPGVGHWDFYVSPYLGINHEIDRRSYRRAFNQVIRGLGFVDGHKVHGTRGFWQGRPIVFWRPDAVTLQEVIDAEKQ